MFGLKQSPKAWFGRFTSVMLSMRYRQSQEDHALFINHSATRGLTVLIVYVDDIVAIGNDKKGMRKLNECLIREFKLKIWGD